MSSARLGRATSCFVGVRHGDAPADAQHLAQKTVGLRVFPDELDRMNLSIQDVGGQILVVSQFTLYAETKRGNRPSFIGAAPADQARGLYEAYVGTSVAPSASPAWRRGCSEP